MRIASRIVEASVRRPKTVTAVMVLSTLLIAAIAALPSFWPERFPFLNSLKVDTDPENMLPADEGVRLFHDAMKERLALHDMVVLGVVNDAHPDGVFNPESLKRIHALTEFASKLQWPSKEDTDKQVGVVPQDIIAPSTVDNLEQGGPNVVKFEPLMRTPPETQEGALAVRDKSLRIPFLKGTMVSEDGKAVCLYLPLTSKDQSYRVYSALKKEIATYTGDDRFFITGLPVAEDTFGVEMFKQMAISAPMAMLIIFILMLIFFRKFILILSPMIVAMVSVLTTMGLLIATGQTVHIMSSMIPIFIMPIAVLDAVHILSEFFDRYQQTKDRRKTILDVMDTLFTPMLYTSLTTAVGFASLALTPIPPVQVFGLFIAFGVMAAWVWTVTFIPAFVMFIPDRKLEGFGTAHVEAHEEHPSLLVRLLAKTGRWTYARAKLIMVAVLIVTAVALWGISRIRINDNPIKWFEPKHPIRVADRVLNEHFGGTYMAYLALNVEDTTLVSEYEPEFVNKLNAQEDLAHSQSVLQSLRAQAQELAKTVQSKDDFLAGMEQFAFERMNEDFEAFDAWDAVAVLVSEERQKGQVFKNPGALAYIEKLQTHLESTGVVGKSNSLADIVKTVHRELFSGETKDYRIPDSPASVAQCLVQYQSSNRPQDVWHFVSKDYRSSAIWVQLKSGDNRDMSAVAAGMAEYTKANPPPFDIQPRWFGLTYINVVWQEKMVRGMLESFLGSFLAVLILMILLYRSAIWGLLCMIPLTVTIGAIYGMIGIVGKDYDMPVAVLSALSLGLSVDYAIHFLTRSRELHIRYGSWAAAAAPVFGEPARAIARNVIVIGVGFLPLLAAPLVPYQTVGIFIAAILIAAGAATLLILPAMIRLLEPFLFPKTRTCCFTCQLATSIITSVALVALVAVNVKQFFDVAWNKLTWWSLAALAVLVLIAIVLSHREKCRRLEQGEKL